MAIKHYLVNGLRVTWRDLIRAAQEYGYCPQDGICFSADAAEVLRANGISVEDDDLPTS